MKKKAEELFIEFEQQVKDGVDVSKIPVALVELLSATKQVAYYQHFYFGKSEQDVPQPSTPSNIVVSVPFAEEILNELNQVKTFARDNDKAYREVVEDIIVRFSDKLEKVHKK